MSSINRSLTCLVAVAAASLIAWRALAGAPPVAEHLPPPASASQAARHLLYTAMRNHGRDMQRLVLAVVLLDDEATGWLADEIGRQPIFTEATKRALRRGGVPERFFEQAEVLRTRAAALEAAARAHDTDAIAPAFTALTQTCVACHRAYLGAD